MEQLNENVQVEEEGVSLMDIIRLLLGKIKLLILVVIIGGILGGSFAVWRTYDVNYFGTKVEFYVNPEKPEESTGTTLGPAAGGSQYGVYGAYGRHVMDNMIKLLSSDSFAEQLLLNGETLPGMVNSFTGKAWFNEEAEALVRNDEGKLEKQLAAPALESAIKEAEAPLAAIAEAETAYTQALNAKATAVRDCAAKEESLNYYWSQLPLSGIAIKKAYYTEEEYEKLSTKPDELVAAHDAYISALGDVQQKTTAANNAEEVWNLAQKEANDEIEAVLDIWRQSSQYASNLAYFKDAVSYNYLASDDDYEDANNLARSFIYVTISIEHSDFKEGVAIGDDILNRVKKVVPMYVEKNMTVPDGYVGTNCQRITRTDDVHLTNPLYTTKEAIKYALLAAAAALVVACVVIIIVDKSDKRLRDTEIITRKFNVPLLGIVPTIEELKVEQAAKNKADKTTEVK